MILNRGLGDASATRKTLRGGSFDKNTTAAASAPHNEYPHEILTKKNHKDLPKRTHKEHQEH